MTSRLSPIDDASFLLRPHEVKSASSAGSSLRHHHPKGSIHFWRSCLSCTLPLVAGVVITAMIIIFLTARKPPEAPRFYQLPIAQNIDCGLLFDDSFDARVYARNLSLHKVTYADDDKSLETSCASIRQRGYFPLEALSQEEADFPIAFARIVYKDYYFLEAQLRVEYAPQNLFCYVLDAKADSLFKKRVRNLQTCFDNVIVPEEELEVHSEGHNMTQSHLNCLKHLRKRSWKYVILLQNNDVRLRTNAELVKLFKAFHGANDISASIPGNHTYAVKANWTYAALKLYKHDQFNRLQTSSGALPTLHVTKSLVQVSISRDAVDFVFEELNVDRLVRRLEQRHFGVDELFWGTLNADDGLQLPGGFTQKCLVKRSKVYMATRFTVWLNEKNPPIPCKSDFFRRWVCVFGVEDLYNLSQMHQIYVNKLLPEFDYAALTCLLENVYNRTYNIANTAGRVNFDIRPYIQLPHVRAVSQTQNFRNSFTKL
uniref:Glycosyltransferase family 92 protein n=1 Tax=Panagrellus redivivus TaxID=6233 RepID=A0A7E4VVT0_PANRE